MNNRIIHKAKMHKQNYDERVNRTEAFLGRTPKEQKQAQELLARSTIGIAGTGGIGGAMALRLARFGVKHIKIADPESFDWSNINRQLGASKDTIGRNKSEVVGEIVYNLAGDVTIEVFKDGITSENATEFVSGCDIILDQLEFYVIKEKFALHKAFRKEKKCKCILACSVVGWNSHLYKFTKESMPIEEWYGISDDYTITDELTDKLIKLWSPNLPHFPPYNEIRRWMKDNNAAPIFAGAPPLAEGILTQRVILSLLDREYPPFAKVLEPIPQMYIYNAATFEGEFVISDGEFKNRELLDMKWQAFDQYMKDKENDECTN